MPYYHAFIEGPITVRGERETEIAEVTDYPISFITPDEMGQREHVLFGKRPITFEAQSHDRGIITATRDVIVCLHHHEQDPDIRTKQETTVKLIKFEVKRDSKAEAYHLRRGDKLPLYRSSFCILGNVKEQIRWSSSMETSSEDFFDDLCLAAAEDVIRGKR